MTVKERPIIFTGPSIPAIIDQGKTQTRRVVTPPFFDKLFGQGVREGTDCYSIQINIHTPQGWQWLNCRYGRSGHHLWVKETWRPADDLAWGYTLDPPEVIAYRADHAALSIDNLLDTSAWSWESVKWKSPLFMPKYASRIKLEVVRIHVERLQAISPADIIAEGIASGDPAEFKEHWNKLNAKRGFAWRHNPWVWVISFKLLSVLGRNNGRI